MSRLSEPRSRCVLYYALMSTAQKKQNIALSKLKRRSPSESSAGGGNKSKRTQKNRMVGAASGRRRKNRKFQKSKDNIKFANLPAKFTVVQHRQAAVFKNKIQCRFEVNEKSLREVLTTPGVDATQTTCTNKFDSLPLCFNEYHRHSADFLDEAPAATAF